ncbi:MAG: SRPBCC family protein [Solirubrobacteraceae bacterium]|nr:SRPBCC family protein [Patulibacter sp.]
MDAIRTQVTIERPPAEIYEYLLDVANYPEFLDHFLVDWHLTREDTYGIGAGARFKVDGKDRFAWGDLTLVEATKPVSITLRGRGGRFNRIRTVYAFQFIPNATGVSTDVVLDVERDASAPFDRMRDAFGGRWSDKRRWRRALGRLDGIITRGEGHGKRVSVSGGPRKPATNSPLR